MAKATPISKDNKNRPPSASDFQFFEGPSAASTLEPCVTIRKNGLMILTRGAVEMLGANSTHVRIGLDSKTNSVGLQAVPSGTRGGYLLRSPKKGNSKIVDGKRFFAHLGLSFAKSQSFEAESFGDGIVGFRLPANL